MRDISILTGILCLIFTLSFVQPAQAQSDDSESFLDQIEALFENDALSFGALLQPQAEVHWDPQAPGQNTFRLGAARFKLYGDLDDNFSYNLQVDVSKSPSLLDANIGYSTDRVAITAGAQKPGISAEFLTSAASTDFVNRSRVVTALVNRRDIGLKAQFAVSPDVRFTAGMFNGTNQNLENSNNTFYYTGRLVFNPDLGDYNKLKVGLNAAHSANTDAVIGNGFLPVVGGERTIYGGDIRLESGRLLLSSEVLIGELEYDATMDDEVTGYHITGGYWVSESAQLLLRYDHIESEALTIAAENMLLAGLNYNFTNTTSLQFNYQINPDDSDFKNHYWLAQLQVAF